MIYVYINDVNLAVNLLNSSSQIKPFKLGKRSSTVRYLLHNKWHMFCSVQRDVFNRFTPPPPPPTHTHANHPPTPRYYIQRIYPLSHFPGNGRF